MGPLVALQERRARTLHTYSSTVGVEVAIVVPINSSKLAPLLPAGYHLLPAATVGLGGPDQGVLAFANFRGTNPSIDGGPRSSQDQVAIDALVAVRPIHCFLPAAG